MNVVPIEKQAQILIALVEGCSVRFTARLVGVHKTILRVRLRVGENCQRLLKEQMQNIRSSRRDARIRFRSPKELDSSTARRNDDGESNICSSLWIQRPSSFRRSLLARETVRTLTI